MKLTQLFGIVVLIHVGVISLLLVQPGCQTKPQSETAPQPSQTRSSSTSTSRPASPAESSNGSGRVDDAFNAGMSGTQSSSGGAVTSGSRTTPTRPGTTTTRTGSSPINSTDVDILQPLQPLTSSTETQSATASTRSYTVQAGDTLSAIARKQKVGIAELRSVNQITGDRIFVGQQLIIPVVEGATTVSSGLELSSLSTNVSGPQRTYTVKSGDTLSKIASQQGTTVSGLRSANNLRSDIIRIGQELIIPGSAGSASTPAPAVSSTSTVQSPPSNGGDSYTVQSGDTPIVIARKLGVDSNELMRINGITDPRRLSVGQKLIVPGRSAASSASATTTTTTSTAGSSGSQTTTMLPRTSTPATISPTTPPPAPEPVDPLELLEEEDLPLVDWETVGE